MRFEQEDTAYSSIVWKHCCISDKRKQAGHKAKKARHVYPTHASLQKESHNHHGGISISPIFMNKSKTTQTSQPLRSAVSCFNYLSKGPRGIDRDLPKNERIKSNSEGKSFWIVSLGICKMMWEIRFLIVMLVLVVLARVRWYCHVTVSVGLSLSTPISLKGSRPQKS